MLCSEDKGKADGGLMDELDLAGSCAEESTTLYGFGVCVHRRKHHSWTFWLLSNPPHASIPKT